MSSLAPLQSSVGAFCGSVRRTKLTGAFWAGERVVYAIGMINRHLSRTDLPPGKGLKSTELNFGLLGTSLMECRVLRLQRTCGGRAR